MYSLDGRLSLQSLSEFESSSRSCIVDNIVPSTPPLSIEPNDNDVYYMGICLPKKLTTIFPTQPQSQSSLTMNVFDDKSRSNNDPLIELFDESCSEYDDEDHSRICLICHNETFKNQQTIDSEDVKVNK